jgi:hypothetical protein
MDGRVLPLDPGRHTVSVAAKSGDRREQAILLAEGEHDRSVVVVFPAPSGPSPAGTAPPASPGSPPRTSRVPVASFILGGLGVLSLGTFAYFAARGASDRASLGCDRGCASGDYSDVDREFVAADVTLVVGVALAGAAVAWWLLVGDDSGKSSKGDAARAEVAR